MKHYLEQNVEGMKEILVNLMYNKTFSKLLIVILCFFILRPSPERLLGDLLAVKIVDFTSLILVVLIIIYLNEKAGTFTSSLKNANIPAAILLIFAFSTLMSQAIASIVLNIPSTYLDLIEMYKYFYYFLILLLGFYFGDLVKSQIFYKYFIVFGFISITIAILQYFNPLDVREFISIFYTETKLRGIESNNPRVFGSFYNANWFGIYIAIWLNMLLINSFYGEYTIKKIYMYLLFLSGIWGLFLTGSRTALLVTFASLIISFFIYLIKSKSYKSFGILLTFSFVTFLSYNFILEKLILSNRRFRELYTAFYYQDFSEVDSLTQRFKLAESYSDISNLNPLSGIGFGNFYELIPHNSFILVNIQFGLWGLFLLVSFFLSLFIISLFNILFFNHSKVLQYNLLLLIITLIYSIVFFTGEYINSIQLMSIFFLMVGFLLRKNRILKLEIRKNQSFKYGQ